MKPPRGAGPLSLLIGTVLVLDFGGRGAWYRSVSPQVLGQVIWCELAWLEPLVSRNMANSSPNLNMIHLWLCG